LTAIYSSPGILQEELILYLATDLTPGESALEDGEKIELRPKTWDEIDAMIDAEEIVDAKTLVALLLARQKLNVGC
jgi:ADP-ribose pyrophosphatase